MHKDRVVVLFSSLLLGIWKMSRTLIAFLGCVRGVHVVASTCSTQNSKVIAGPLVPRRVDVSESPGWHNAFDVLFQDGAVVLKGLANLTSHDQTSFRDLAATLPAHLFTAGSKSSKGKGLELLSPNAPVNGVHDELREAKQRDS